MLTRHIRQHINLNSFTKTFLFFLHTQIIHALETTMLPLDEEVTPTASLHSASSRSDELMAAHFPGPNAIPALAPSSNLFSRATCSTTASDFGTASSTRQRINAPNKRLIDRKTDVKQSMQFKCKCKCKWVSDSRLSSDTNCKKTQEVDMTRGIVGMNTSILNGYLPYIADQQASKIELETLQPTKEIPFLWMGEMINLIKSRNSFEISIIEHHCGAVWPWT